MKSIFLWKILVIFSVVETETVSDTRSMYNIIFNIFVIILKHSIINECILYKVDIYGSGINDLLWRPG